MAAATCFAVLFAVTLAGCPIEATKTLCLPNASRATASALLLASKTLRNLGKPGLEGDFDDISWKVHQQCVVRYTPKAPCLPFVC